VPKFTRWLVAPVITALALVGLVATPAQATPVALGPFTAAADAYTADNATSTTFGTTDPQSCFVNDSAPARRCYLAFTVSGIQAGDTVTSASVLIRNKGGGGTKTVEMFATSSFSESSISWGSQPTLGAQQGSATNHVFQADSTFAVNSGVITGNGTYYFALAPTNVSSGLNFYTKDNTVGQPGPRLSVNINRPQAPVAALSLPATTSSVDSVTADASGSTDPDTNTLTYTFAWGDGSTTGPQAGPTASHLYSITGNYTVTVTVSDGSRSDTETDTIQSRPEFGSNANGKFRSTYDPIKVQRVFGGTTPSTVTWGTGDLAAAITTVVSIKPSVASVNAGTVDSAWRTWAGTIPTDRKVHIYLWHEPENDVYTFGTFTAAQWRAANIHLRSVIMANKPAGADVSWDIDLMSATLNTAGRNWQDFWPDNDTNFANGSPYVDVLAWDNYWGGGDDNGYPTRTVGGVTVFNDVFYRFGTSGQRDIFAVNASVNTPMGIGEWGYDDDATRVTILQQIEKFAIYGGGPGPVGTQPSSTAHPPVSVEYVAYFDVDDTIATTGDHDLDRTDGADRSEWERIVAA